MSVDCGLKRSGVFRWHFGAVGAVDGRGRFGGLGDFGCFCHGGAVVARRRGEELDGEREVGVLAELRSWQVILEFRGR